MQDFLMMFFDMGPLKIIGCLMFVGLIILMCTSGQSNKNNNNQNNSNTSNTSNTTNNNNNQPKQ